MILDEIVAHKKVELEAAKQRLPLPELLGMVDAAPPRRDYLGALRRDRMALIAEIKRASPSKGAIKSDFSLLGLVQAYVAGGADVISVLTDERFFGGTLDDLRQAAQYGTLPILRKDFLIDPYQVYEAAAAGASSALLIVGIVPDTLLAELVALQRSLGLEPQVEVHDEDQVERAMTAGATIIGINNRDLRTFQVDLGTTERLRPRIPPDGVVVSESGIHTRTDVERLARAGVQAIHVGESLMVSEDPARKIRELLGSDTSVRAPDLSRSGARSERRCYFGLDHKRRLLRRPAHRAADAGELPGGDSQLRRAAASGALLLLRREPARADRPSGAGATAPADA